METVQLYTQQMEALSQIACTAIQTVDKHYGINMPGLHPAEIAELAYHNGHHARVVKRNSGITAEAADLPPEGRRISETAGATHDVIQQLGRGVDEAESAAWLIKRLQAIEGMPKSVAAIGALAILGTEPIFVGGVLVNQKANLMDYPSLFAEHVAKSVASGDFGELYQPQGPLLGHELYREIHKTPADKMPPMDGLLDYQRSQVQLMHSYEYPLAEAEVVLATHRSQTTTYAEHVLKQLERGEIHTFDQLLAQDAEFMLGVA